MAVVMLAPALLVGQPVYATTPSAALSGAPTCESLHGEGAREITQGELKLAWRAVPHPIPLNQVFELLVTVCGDEAAQLVRVDADMPAHRHGMNYRTTLTKLDAGRTRVKGLLFHMPGRWRLVFDIQQGGRRLRLTDTVDLP